MLLDVYGGLSLVTPVISPGLVSKVELTGRLNLRNLASAGAEVAVIQRKGWRNSNL
jgi:hypothetical protein